MLFDPDDYIISLARNIKFKPGKDKADIAASLQSAVASFESFAISAFSNQAKIVTHNEFFTYDFETSGYRSRPDGEEQRQEVQDLADSVHNRYLRYDYRSSRAFSSFHLSFGLVRADEKTVSQMETKVINILKRYNVYAPLTSTDMQIDEVDLLESVYDKYHNDAYRYEAFVAQPLSASAAASPATINQALFGAEYALK